MNKGYKFTEEHLEKHRQSHVGKNVKHGMTKTKFYKVWENIQTRIKSTNHSSYKNYGGKGIVCEWKTFQEFKDDMEAIEIQESMTLREFKVYFPEEAEEMAKTL